MGQYSSVSRRYNLQVNGACQEARAVREGIEGCHNKQTTWLGKKPNIMYCLVCSGSFDQASATQSLTHVASGD